MLVTCYGDVKLVYVPSAYILTKCEAVSMQGLITRENKIDRRSSRVCHTPGCDPTMTEPNEHNIQQEILPRRH